MAGQLLEDPTALIDCITSLYRGRTMNFVLPPAVAFPDAAVDAILAHRAELPPVPMNLYTMHLPYAYPCTGDINIISSFYAHAEREMPATKSYDVQFSDMYWHYMRTDPSLVITQATAPFEDQDGQLVRSLGPNCDYTWDVIDAGIPVFVVENPALPRVNGNWFPETAVVGVMHTSRPLYAVKGRPSTEDDQAMAALIVDEIPDAATLQLGVGGLAVSVVERIAEVGHTIGGVWTEAIGSWAATLEPGVPVVGTIAFGTAELYEWMNENPDVTMLPARVTNSRDKLQSHRVHSVNQAMKINLSGGTSLIPHYSGQGGGCETTYGAYRSFVAAPHTRKGECNIAVASTAADYALHDPTKRAQYLVTPAGITETWPRWDGDTFHDGSAESVARGIIEDLTPPEFQDELTRGAVRAGILTETET